jgi:phosphoribosylamine--glycine ligase
MKVLVLGSGAREHALALRLHRDGAEVLCSPGNAGTAGFARTVALPAAGPEAVAEAIAREAPGLVVVGPEAPLVAGLVDALASRGVLAFGPDRAAARLEGSKVFAKELMRRHGVPTADFRVFDDPVEAEAFVAEADRPLVIKADGLCAGKGVVVAGDASEAVDAIRRLMVEREFGDAGARIVIEECLAGEEVSYHVVCDGSRFVALAPAQDHKRVFDGDRGPNTGGMGAYSPPPFVTPAMEADIVERIVRPTVEGMAQEGTPFRGALFVGLMIEAGEPKVLEYNVRFGDPETEVLMARFGGPLLPLLEGAARGDLAGAEASWQAAAALTVVLASRGYPGAYDKGKPITGLEAAEEDPAVTVFHAGTRMRAGAEKVVETAGGRVLAVTATGDALAQAAARAYAAADHIEFEGKQLRRDIGARALAE